MYDMSNCENSELENSQLMKNCGEVVKGYAILRRKRSLSSSQRYDTPWSE